MTAAALPMPRPSRRIPILPILILLAVAGAGVIYGAHAVERHGSDAVRVRECLENQGPIQQWYNPVMDRHIQVCQTGYKEFGIQVLVREGGRWKEVTAFVKDRARSLDAVGRYLTDSGAFKTWPK